MANRPSDKSRLESLKKRAKALLRAWRADDAAARERIRRHHPDADRFRSLRDAQLVIAREHGHRGWVELREAVEAEIAAARPRAERVERFLDDACLSYRDDHPRRRTRAQRLLDADPSLARENALTAAAAADVDALREHVAADPGCATRSGGPRGWPPLMYLCYARLAHPVGDAVDAAGVLLDAGADPNAGERMFDAYLFTPLTGAMGEGEGGLVMQPPHARARPLAELLLARGAHPNDSQGLYNTQFTPDDDWIELLLAHGLTAADGANWLGGEASLGTLDYLLGVAVTRGFGARVELLLEHGADPDGRDFYDQRRHAENALLYGHPEIAERLAARGAAPPALSPADRFRAACMAADEDTARALLGEDPTLIEDGKLVHDAAQFGSDAAARLVFELGGSLTVTGPHFGETPLHRAAIEGRDALAEQLIELGARLDVRDREFDGSPVGWANQGGHEALRERLLDRTEDVFDLSAWGRVDQLRARLESDPTQARATRANGVTPLHYLAVDDERCAEVIDLLCEHGADPNARTEEGTTPLAAALARDDEELADLLRECGASED